MKLLGLPRGVPNLSIAPAPLITLAWLVRLRWAAVIGQLFTVLVAWLALQIPLPLWPLFGVITLTGASNLLLAHRLRQPEPPSSGLLAGVIVADSLLLTGMLVFSGGPANPFSVLYLLHVALAVIVLGLRWGFALVGVSAVSFALLYAFSEPLPGLTPPSSPAWTLHLTGSWLAYLVAACFVAYFLGHMTSELRRREDQLADARAKLARDERLTSLSTLAAGAAHELGTPLATIAVVAREAERAAQKLGDATLEDDARLIRKEVERCRTILLQMSAQAGESVGEMPAAIALSKLVDEVRAALKPMLVPRLSVSLPPGEPSLVVPRQALVLVLASLVKNAFDASASGDQVQLVAEMTTDGCRLSVIDRGEGMPAEVLRRAGEPFYTTKPEGTGTGLGLFLARAFAERLGGRLELESSIGIGTRATLVLPVRPPEESRGETT